MEGKGYTDTETIPVINENNRKRFKGKRETKRLQ